MEQEQQNIGPRRFFVTGGSRGIGAAIVTLATQRGHHVVFTGGDVGRVDQVAARAPEPSDSRRTWPSAKTMRERFGRR